MSRLIYITIVLFSFLFAAVPTSNLKTEYRAMWVTRYELSSSSNIPIIVQKAVSNNFNALFVQVCGRGTAFYDSTLLPRDSTALDYDALGLLLREAKKYDLEIHAWINMMYVWSDRKMPGAKNHVLNEHSDWLLNAGQPDLQKGNYFLNPALAEVRSYVKAICLEVAQKYTVSGIHLDYIRYPGQEQVNNDARACKEFEQKAGVDPRALLKNKEVAQKLYGEEQYKDYLEKWSQFNRDNITQVVGDLSQELAKVKPEILLSAAVISDYEQARLDYFQDWQEWMAKGYLDMVIPMAYSTNEKDVKKQIVFATQAAEKYDCPILIGLGAWRLKPDSIVKSVLYTREIREKMGFKQLAGVVLFSYDKIAKEENYLERLKQKVFTKEALVPALSYNKGKLVEQNSEFEEQLDNPNNIDLKYHCNIIG